jgi:SAM-dependent methyltransferase
MTPVQPGPIDKLELYRWAVQDPETHAIVLRTMYEQVNGRTPILLREDFAGTSAESVAWVILHHGGRAMAVDRDAPTVEWARRRAVRLVGPLASRISFFHDDVRNVGPPEAPAADIISVLNYSILYQREQQELLSYFRHALNCLAPDGILVCNFFGGADAVQTGATRSQVTPNPRLSTEAPIAPFEYVWEVRSYDPALQRLDCRIHFFVPDPSMPNGAYEVRDAFQYDWRLWSAPELIEACQQASFAKVQLWRHSYDPLKGADGVFLGPVQPDSLPAAGRWSAYIVARR